MATLFPGVGLIKRELQEDIWQLYDLQDNIENENAKEKEKNTDEKFICPECSTDSSILIDNEEVVCVTCGNHLCYLIDSSAEYRWFGSEDRHPDPSRVGNPINPLLPESSLGTRILTRPGDNKAMRRIRQYHLWNIMPYRERTLWTVFEMLQVRASNAGISVAIVEETKQLYSQVSRLCICRGQQKDALLAACLYESLKRHDTPRRPLEIAKMFQIDAKLITRGVKQFSGLLEEHLHTAKPTHYNMPDKVETPSTNFRHYLEPAVYKLETPRTMHGQIIEYASRIGNTIDELGICPETMPASLAASALTLTCEKFNLGKSNHQIASVCDISSATLQKCLKRIQPWRTVLCKDT
jgi:transcription initiation factor TFIIIB Brf1 subunit/transcription initiation factor TFIIB